VDDDEIKTETERNNIKFFSIDTYLVNMRNENLRNNEESQNLQHSLHQNDLVEVFDYQDQKSFEKSVKKRSTLEQKHNERRHQST